MKIVALLLLSLVLLAGCATKSPLPDGPFCVEGAGGQRVGTVSWLQLDRDWVLRQSVLLKIGWKKFALDGYLQVNPSKHEARLIALNEMGIVLFDLSIDATTARFNRALAQLQEQHGADEQITASIRKVFFSADWAAEDQQLFLGNGYEMTSSAQRRYFFDCDGQLSRIADGDEGWTVDYKNYTDFRGIAVAKEIILDDRHNHLQLSLWIREIRE